MNLSYCENYPTVNIEAMACGTPVLTYKTGGSPEIIKKYGGIIVDQGDIITVAEKIRLIKKVGISSVKIDRNRVDKNYAMYEYLNLYKGEE